MLFETPSLLLEPSEIPREHNKDVRSYINKGTDIKFGMIEIYCFITFGHTAHDNLNH